MAEEALRVLGCDGIERRGERLVQGVEAHRHPAIWHGLWLYDRRSGRLLGYKHDERPTNENEVDLRLFYGSIASPENFGAYGCSFMEMIERGANRLGYFCAGASCAPPEPSSGPRTSGLPAVVESVIGTTSPRGRMGERLRPTVCQRSSSGDGGGRGGAQCGAGPTIAGASRAADTVRCLSQQIVRPGTEAFRCMAEATGRCSNPVDRLTKILQQVQFSGVKVGRSCQVAAGPRKADADYQKAEREAYEQLLQADRAAEEKAQRAIDEALKRYEQDLRKAEDNYQKMLDAANNELNPDDQAFWVDIAATNRQNDYQIAEERRDEAIKAARDTEASEKEEAREKYQGDVKKAQDKRDQQTGGRTCPPGTPDCGDNSCTAMSDAARQTMQCFQQATNAGDVDPFRNQPGGCNPQICDPIEPAAPANSAITMCFGPMLQDPQSATSKQCWAVQCTPGQIAMAQAGGACGCREAPTAEEGRGGIPNMCEKMRCAPEPAASGEATGIAAFPIMFNGGCVCGGQPGLAGPGGGVPPPTPGPFVLGEPSTFSQINRRVRARGPGLPIDLR